VFWDILVYRCDLKGLMVMLFVSQRLQWKGRLGKCTEQVFVIDKEDLFLFWDQECRYNGLDMDIFS